jgi:DNA topoisomerase-1
MTPFVPVPTSNPMHRTEKLADGLQNLMEPKVCAFVMRAMERISCSPSSLISADNFEASKTVANGLVYVSSLDGAIIRKAGEKEFLYLKSDGTRVADPQELARIAALAIPPAYTDVLISADPNSYLQAVGIDAKGRRQYRYHRDWLVERERAKFDRLPAFGAALPQIRQRIDSDLRQRKPTADRAIATVVWLLDRLFFRVGNRTYAEENKTCGITTLRNRHVKIHGESVHFRFKGKSGKEWRLTHTDRRIANAIKKLQELPGQHLFQYLDEEGVYRSISSQDVNAYIKVASADDFTSRQFRTWGATCLAANALSEIEVAHSQREKMQQINLVVDHVAVQLLNTRAVCKSSYIHPQVFEDFESGKLANLRRMRPSRSARLTTWMDDEEVRVLRWLQAHSRND